MLRSLGVFTLFKWFFIACVGVAVWRAYNGDLGQITTAIWQWVEKGADVATGIWNQINKN